MIFSFSTSIDLEEIKQQKRDIWLNLQQENPELSKTEIRKLAPDVYAWLYRRDRTWLNNNSPKLKKPKASVNRVDWNVRDKEILEQAKSIVEKLLKEKKPVRITVGRVGSSLGLKGLLDKHLYKLPLTRTYLESVTETVEDFQIRRIDWAIAVMVASGELNSASAQEITRTMKTVANEIMLNPTNLESFPTNISEVKDSPIELPDEEGYGDY